MRMTLIRKIGAAAPDNKFRTNMNRSWLEIRTKLRIFLYFPHNVPVNNIPSRCRFRTFFLFFISRLILVSFKKLTAIRFHTIARGLLSTLLRYSTQLLYFNFTTYHFRLSTRGTGVTCFFFFFL